MSQTILITGASRGIGLEMTRQAVARGDVVVAVVRRPEAAEELNQLASLSGKIDVQSADATDEASLAALAGRLGSRAIDILVANAGVYLGRGGIDDPALSREAWAETLMTNVYGPFATIRALLPALQRSAAPKAAIIASHMGSSARAPGGSYAYRASKAAAINLACNLAAELKPSGVAVGAYHPGWVRTDMGGSAAAIDVEESAAGLLRRFDALSLETTGIFEDYNGELLAY